MNASDQFRAMSAKSGVLEGLYDHIDGLAASPEVKATIRQHAPAVVDANFGMMASLGAPSSNINWIQILITILKIWANNAAQHLDMAQNQILAANQGPNAGAITT